MKPDLVHVIGAGLAGLSAAIALAEKNIHVELYEAAGFAGGRCRSYFEPQLQRVIDNGNHLILSGNRAVQRYLRTIGSEKNFIVLPRAEFAFADIRTGKRWSLCANDGALPWWIFSSQRRVPETRARDYLGLISLLRAKNERLGAQTHRGVLWERLIHPFLLAALNTEPEVASRKLIAGVMRETLAAGGNAYKPRIAHPTLAAAFVDPALAFLKQRGAAITFGRRLHRIRLEAGRVTTLEFADSAVPIDEKDLVILAVPPPVAASLLPSLTVPDEFRAIVSAHFGIAPPPDVAPMIGVIGGTAEWIFCFPDRVSVTVSNAGRLIDTERSELAASLWHDAATVLGLRGHLPAWQIVKEKRATFAATPEQEAKRPPARTSYRNLYLAGDWTDTGLPATIEGAVRSGYRAAELAFASAPV